MSQPQAVVLAHAHLVTFRAAFTEPGVPAGARCKISSLG